MTRNGPLTDKNAPAASETDVSQPSKKQRLGDAQPADQERQVVPYEPPLPQQDARLVAEHKRLALSVSRTLENAAWTLYEFCNNDADRPAVLTEICDGALDVLERLVAAGGVGGFDRVALSDDRASAISATDQEQVVPFQPPQQDARLAAEHKRLALSVSRALENAAWTLDEFCDTDADRPAVWREMSDGAQVVIARLVAARRVDDRAIVARATPEEEETTPVDEEVPEEATEEDRLDEGWISKKRDVDDAVAAAKAAAAAQSDGELTQLQAALAKCGEEGAPGSLEMIPKKDLTTKTITDIIDIKGVVGASYSGLFTRGERIPKVKAQKRIRPRLKELIKVATKNKSVALEKAEVETRLGLELAAAEALPDDEPDVTTLRSLLACSLLLAEANPKILTVSKDGQSGNVDELVNALRKSGVELVGSIDGDALENTNENRVLCVIHSLENAIGARPPQEVVKAVLGRIGSLKHAPRANKMACAALASAVKSRAISFAARGAESAAKVKIKLPDFPIISDETLERRTAHNVEWTAAPAAARADVWSGVPRDSYALRTAAPLQQWPKWLGRPTIVADPLTDIEGGELTTTKSWDALAKSLTTGERIVQGKLRKQQGGSGEE